MEQSGNDHILVKTGSIQYPGHGDDVFHVRHTAAATNLTLMTYGSEAQGLLEPGARVVADLSSRGDGP